MTAKDDLTALVRRGLRFDLPEHGPQKPLINVRPRSSAVLVLFSESDAARQPHATPPIVGGDPSQLEVLLTRRHSRMRHHPGEIAFPGGGVDRTDAGPEAAALREAREEAGIVSEGVEVLGRLPQFLIPVSNNIVTPVLGWWSAPSATVADMYETSAIFDIPVAQLLDPDNRGMSEIMVKGKPYRGPAFRVDVDGTVRTVWGFTAMVLASIFDHAGWTREWDRRRTYRISR